MLTHRCMNSSERAIAAGERHFGGRRWTAPTNTGQASARMPFLPDDVGRRLTSQQMTTHWLSVMRWYAVAGQLIAVWAGAHWFGLPLPVVPLLTLIGVTAFSNLFCSRLPMALTLALDVGLLTGLLAFSGGASNPFVVVYILHVALASFALRPLEAGGIALWSLFGYAVLHFLPPSLVVPSPLFFRGLPVAIALCSAIICVFIVSLVAALRRQEAQRSSSDRLASLGAFAAEAAHELGSPLATIAVVASDMVDEDGLLIRDEVDRCQKILQRMHRRAGQMLGETVDTLRASSVAQQMLDELRSPDAKRVTLHVESDGFVRCAPVGLQAALSNLVNNALEASKDTVELRLMKADKSYLFIMVDRGEGLSKLQLERIGEPFFSTKASANGAALNPEHHGTRGLGVFLVRTFAERSGGSLRFESQVGSGTRAYLSLPVAEAPTERATASDTASAQMTTRVGGSHG